MNQALTRQDRVDSFIPELFRRWARPLQLMEAGDLPADIRVDISDTGTQYVVTAEIPGAKKEDVHISIDGNYISISAEVKKEHEEKHGRSLVKETYRGCISRSFSLASEVNEKDATAKLQDGVLHLTLPKRESTSKHVLEIQ